MSLPPVSPQQNSDPVDHQIGDIFDPDWYQQRYPDIAAAGLDPLLHFIRYGAAENRDPNSFFDSAWYVEHYPDVAASGLNPLMHYLQAGAAELRNPHPRFDAVFYAEQHPAAAANPLLYHLRIGITQGNPTERPVDIRDYLPSVTPPSGVPRGVIADVVIRVHDGLDSFKRCIRSVWADRRRPLGRIIVVDDHSLHLELVAWLQTLAAKDQIHLIRNRRRLGLGMSARVGAQAAKNHDVVLLDSKIEVPAGWLRRLAAHAYSQPNIATVSPLDDATFTPDDPDDEAISRAWTRTATSIDELCQSVNTGRCMALPETSDRCVYIRRAALDGNGYNNKNSAATNFFAHRDFCLRTTATGWQHRLAYDTFVSRNANPSASGHQSPTARPPSRATDPFLFVLTAALFRDLDLPVILMVSHIFGGGVRRHIDSLQDRYRNIARFLLLEGSNRGAALSVPAISSEPVLTLPPDRLDDLATVLRSAHVSRVHIHHLLRMDMDVRALVHRLGVPFDVTVHDYYAICPQINLLSWPEGLYCGEPGPDACNACIAGQSSHGARDIISWRRDRTWQFTDADRVICPSQDAKARLDRYGLGGRAIVVPHETPTDIVWTTHLPKTPSGPLHIVLLGVLANHKGARAVAELAESVDAKTIQIHLIGHLEDSFPQPAKQFIKATGRYADCDLPAILQRIKPHVFWFPSSAPETYSYTLSTAIATGLPIVATNLGSFTERLAGRPYSWLVDHRASVQDWLAVFARVRKTLHDRTGHPTVSRPCAAEDFYTGRYLNPTAKTPPAAPARKLRIAIVAERYRSGGLTPCGYIRLLQPLDHLAIGGLFDIELADPETVLDCDADIIVTQRHSIPDLDTVNRLMRHARRTGAKLLYDLDDDLLDVPVTHPDSSTLRPLAKVVRRMLTVADAVWVSTAGLAERLAPIRQDAIVIENRLDERIWAHGPAPTSFWADPIRILCMGTNSHERDFAMIEPVLLRLKAEYGYRIAIDILGMTSRNELPAELNRIGLSTYASRSYPGFVNWVTTMQPRWHIGLAPLLDTPFNQGKSPIKAMEYAAMGLAVLASDTPVYRGSIADGPAGQLVANDPAAWHAALDWLIRNPNFRECTASRARSEFIAHATLGGHAEVRKAALTNLVQGSDRLPRLRDAARALTIPHGTTNPTTRKGRHSGRGG